MQQLSALDAIFAYLESGNQYMHVAGLSLYDPSTVPVSRRRNRDQDVVSHKDILNEIERTLHVAPNMRRRLLRVPGDIDHPWWVEDENFDIEFHVRHIALPEPGDWQQLCILIARLHSRGLDMSKPLWESYIIEGLDNITGLPEGCFGLFTKVHHAAIDGATGAAQTLAMHTLSPDEEVPTPSDPWQSEPDPSGASLLARAYFNGLISPLRAGRVMGKALPGLLRAGRGVLQGKLKMPISAPRTRFNTKISPHRIFDSRVFDLNDFRDIKKATDTTINDVVLTVCGGAMRHYLADKKELPEASMVAMIPINVRTEDEKMAAGNQVSSMTAAIGTHISDPRERLQFVSQSQTQAKEVVQTAGEREISEMTGLAFPPVIALSARAFSGGGFADYMMPPINIVITNVPGPQVPLYLGGARLVSIFGLGPLVHNQGMIIVIQSYAGVVTISFTVCRSMMPDPHIFAEALYQSFRELHRAVMGKDTRTHTVNDMVKVATQREIEAGNIPDRKPKRSRKASKKGSKKEKASSPSGGERPRGGSGDDEPSGEQPTLSAAPRGNNGKG